MIIEVFKKTKNKICYLIQKMRIYPIKKFGIKYTKVNRAKKLKKYMLIDRGAYHYPYFNISALKCLVANMLYAFYKGYIPYINLADRRPGEFNWDVFFKQPFENSINDKNLINKEYKKQKFNVSPYYIRHKFVYNKMEVLIWSKVFNDFVVLNEETNFYVENEYKRVIPNNKRVLGVVCRGTDYVVKKPSRHPVQPTPEFLINHIKDKTPELKIDFIYLATEEKRIVELFESAFPGKIITNTRSYYDEKYYSANENTYIGDITFERENDNYLKGLEYLSSIYILSKCFALIGGNCGASQGALYLNNLKYEFYELINLGLYE